MFKSKKILIVLLSLVILFVFAVLFSFFINQREINNNLLKYPGNGIPHLSKNKPVKSLNEEMKEFFIKNKEFVINKQNIKFENISNDITFQSSKEIIGPVTNLSLEIYINSGEAIITIGNDVKYIITSPESSILQDNKKILSIEEKLSTKGIGIASGYSTDKKTEIVNQAQILIKSGWRGEYVNLSFPAPISIELTQGSSGMIGQWEWVRGLE